MIAFLKRRWFLTFIGFVLLAAFIWFAGPLFAFAEYHPLEPEPARIVAFALVFGFWLIAQLWKRLRAFRASDRLLAGVVRQAVPESQPSAEAVQLRERFEQATTTLKAMRRSGHTVYELPWYVIIGAPGSGKTTALLNSGLKFPLEQRSGRGAIRGVGGTRNCDWWFTDEAVFLDTAGRYTTQDSDAESDHAGWSEFLTLLRKYRTRRPLNGVILTISAQDLMLQGERAREAHVDAARRRLQELNRELKIQLPVYVMVTKCDLLAGFAEYFDDLTQDGRAQVWGVTFPYEQTLDGSAIDTYPEEFDRLIARLNARVFARVEDDRDVRRRTRIFAFPQQVAALRGALTDFVTEVFGGTRAERQILLRGVYFTSGTQEGTPIDRLLGTLGRRYGVAPDAVVPPTGRGKAYFVERLLKEVMIGESGLAGLNRRLEMKKAAAQLGSYAAMTLVAVLGLFALSVSYARNQGYLADVAAALSNLESAPPLANARSPQALLPRLDAIKAVVDTANRHRESAPWSMRWGLFQGTSVGNAARDAYVRELDATLLPRVAGRIEERLVEYATQPERLYEYLKAYVMLGEPNHAKKEHLQFVSNLEWHAADNAAPETAARLSEHFESLLAYGDTLRPIGLNPTLLEQARRSVGRASIPQIIYSRLRREYREDSARAVRLDVAGGVGVETLFRRKSGISLSEPVPSFFTPDVFHEITSKQTPDLVKTFASEEWVWGGDGSSSRVSSRLGYEVGDRYERDYLNAWQRVLDDLELVPFTTIEQALDGLERLSGPTSPLRGLISAVAENTMLVREPQPDPQTELTEAAKKKITDKLGAQKMAERLGSLFGQGKGAAEARPPGYVVTAHFQPIHRLVTGEPGSTPLDQVLVRLGQVHHQLRTLGASSKVEALWSPEFRELLRALQQDAQTLPPVMQDTLAQIGRRAERSAVDSATSDLDRRYREYVLRECADKLAGRYPFGAGSENDLPLANFAEVFGYGGLFDTFFKENLQGLVDRSKTPWRWRTGVTGTSDGILRTFERAQRIKELFFQPGTGALEVTFILTVVDVDSSSIRFFLEVDGQAFEQKGPARSLVGKWPGPKPGNAAARWFEKFGGEPSIVEISPWGFFKLLDRAKQERLSDIRTNLVFSYQAHYARLVLEAASINNPFIDRSWQQFSCQF